MNPTVVARLLGVALALTISTAPAALAWADESSAGERKLCRIDAPELVESSALVETAEGWVSTNDSGDSARLFLLDPSTCAELGQVDWKGEPDDVEALADAGRGRIWVGDVGDNEAEREEVELTLVSLADGSVLQRRTLRYPDGPQDAEAMATHPVTGEVVVISKSVFGGTVFLVPGEGDRLIEVGLVTGLVTDAAFWGPERLVVRTYSEAVCYSWPDLTELGRLKLPGQEQGEGMAVSGDTLLLTSEGIDQPVWRVSIPRAWGTADGADPSAAAGTGQAPPEDSQRGDATQRSSPESTQTDPLAEERARRGRRMLITGAIAGVGLLLLLRSLRPR